MTTATIKLKFPVTADGTEIKQLQMRRAKVRDMRAAEKASGGSASSMEIHLFANLCEVAPAVMDEIDMADYTKIQETYEGFLSRK